MTYSTTKFKVATSNGLGGDTFTRNVTDVRTDGQADGRMRTDFDAKLIYPIFLKKKAGIKSSRKKWCFAKIRTSYPEYYNCLSYRLSLLLNTFRASLIISMIIM